MTSIGPYRILNPLGSGAYGDVMLATKNDVLYAIKRVSILDITTTLMEISLLQTMNHPHIVKPYEYIKDENTINIVMERGRAPLSSMKVDNIDLRMFLWQVLSALDYMHQNGIIHRDLKPDNIMMGASNYPMIIDLGLAYYSPFEDLPMNHHIQTPGYKAPEVLAMEPYDSGVDIFSMGVIMYELVKGTKPFDRYVDRITQSDIDDALLQLGPIRPNTIESMIQMMLTADPRSRPTAADLMNMPFFRPLGYHVPDMIYFNDDMDENQYDGFDKDDIHSFINDYGIDTRAVNYVRAMVIRSPLETINVGVIKILLATINYNVDPDSWRLIRTMARALRVEDKIMNDLFDTLVSLNMTIY